MFRRATHRIRKGVAPYGGALFIATSKLDGGKLLGFPIEWPEKFLVYDQDELEPADGDQAA
jgi:hypothetical protein